ncbi:MAG TPA: hypothetical protein VKJ65_11170, partial [Phycisphaerae bacterium]|nr:hypothetical protein [Phycisphaerae bacterium]
MNDPILPMMLLTAVAGAMLVFILPRQSGRAIGWTAFFLSLVPTLLGVMLLYSFSYSQGGDWQNACNYDWMPQFGMKFSLGVDAISLWLLALTLVVTPLCILDGIDKVHQRQNEFFGWMLLLYAGMIGVFTA